MSVTNYAWGGQLTRSWITDTSVGLPKLESDAAKGLYILALERNDYNRENNGTSGYLAPSAILKTIRWAAIPTPSSATTPPSSSASRPTPPARSW